jgi:carboxymethylenebutenolidase
MKRALLVLLMVVGVQAMHPVCAQDWARDALAKSSLKHEWVTVKSGDRALQTFVVHPAAAPRAVVLMIHEVDGMTDWAQSMAEQIAELGYVVVAPDLLSGAGPNGGRTDSFASGDKAREAVEHLSADQVTADLNAVADYGEKLDPSGVPLMVVGFSWGGTEAFRYAASREDDIGTLVFCGTAPDKDAFGKIKGEVLGFYAEKDDRVNATLAATQANADAAHIIYEPVTYAGAEHGFMRLGQAPDASAMNKKAMLDAINRMKIDMSKMASRGY